MSGYLAEIFDKYGTEIWCDSPIPADLDRMLGIGACGATSNPVLIGRAIEAAPDRWATELPACRAEGGLVNWSLYRKVAKLASERLLPLYERTQGARGVLSVQVDPRLWNNVLPMIAMAREARAIAPNISVKVPATKAGLIVAEELAAEGINCTVTVSYTVPQVLAIGDAFRRGKERAIKDGKLPAGEPLHSWAVLMVGRLDDHLRDVVKEGSIDVSQELLTKAGTAVAKKAYALYRERGYESKLLIAAMRGNYHIDQYIGGDLVVTVPPANEVQLAQAYGGIAPPCRIDEPVAQAAIDELYERFPDFRRAYDVDGMSVEEFEQFGSCVKTLAQFKGGWEGVIRFVEERQ
jgi:transaldolase